MGDLARVFALEASASTVIECDLTKAVQQLRYVRFAEYCLIFVGLALALQYFLA